jgi:hypothetical protein
MGTSGTGHGRCPSLVLRAHQAPGDWKIIKIGICFKGLYKIFSPYERRHGGANLSSRERGRSPQAWGKPVGIADANYAADTTAGAREIQQEQILVSLQRRETEISVWSCRYKHRILMNECLSRALLVTSRASRRRSPTARRCVGTNFSELRSMRESHRPPFTTAPVADSQRSPDPLLFTSSARADSQRRWLRPQPTEIFECDG